MSEQRATSLTVDGVVTRLREVQTTLPAGGLTVKDVAARLRVGCSKVRGWIARRELTAVNTAGTLSGKPRWVVTPEALAAFERARQGGEPPRPAPRRRARRAPGYVDYYPDGAGGRA